MFQTRHGERCAQSTKVKRCYPIEQKDTKKEKHNNNSLNVNEFPTLTKVTPASH